MDWAILWIAVPAFALLFIAKRLGLVSPEAARAQLQEGADASVHLDRAVRRLDHAGDDLQQRRLAGAVFTDHAERLPAAKLEGHAVDGAEHAGRAPTTQQVPYEPQPAATRFDLRVVLADALEPQQWRAHRRARSGSCARHTKSSKCGERRRKKARPAA